MGILPFSSHFAHVSLTVEDVPTKQLLRVAYTLPPPPLGQRLKISLYLKSASNFRASVVNFVFSLEEYFLMCGWLVGWVGGSAGAVRATNPPPPPGGVTEQQFGPHVSTISPHFPPQFFPIPPQCSPIF